VPIIYQEKIHPITETYNDLIYNDKDVDFTYESNFSINRNYQLLLRVRDYDFDLNWEDPVENLQAAMQIDDGDPTTQIPNQGQ